MTLHDRYCIGLRALGFQQIASTGRYTRFSAGEQNGKPIFWYIGHAGALRRGTSIATSHPATDTFKQKVLNSLTDLMQGR